MKTISNMKNTLIMFVILALAVLQSACVTVKLASPPKTRQAHVKFSSPKSFEEVDAHGADKAWRNKKTGTTIAYQTECAEDEIAEDYLLNQFLNSFESIEKINRETQSDTSILHHKVSGTGLIDKMPIQFRTIMLNQKTCQVLLMLFGRVTSEDLTVFQKFETSFEVQE